MPTVTQQLALADLLKELRDKRAYEFHHGDCIRSDALAHQIARRLGYYVVVHPPLEKANRAFVAGADRTLQPRSYHDRNHDIVNICHWLIGLPRLMVEELRSGTWATIRYARKMNKRITLVMPDGSRTEENAR